MGNTVGSYSSLLTNPKDSYILGLWGADKYVRTSSVGLSNTNLLLINRFGDFLLSRLPKSRLRLRIYGSTVPENFKDVKISFCKGSKNKSPAFHIYVNCRALGREFAFALENRYLLQNAGIYPYFSGRFDGDGSIAYKDSKPKFCRIVYGNLTDLEKDRALLKDIKTSVYHYRKAGTYCLYFSEQSVDKFLERVGPYLVSKNYCNPVSTDP